MKLMFEELASVGANNYYFQCYTFIGNLLLSLISLLFCKEFLSFLLDGLHEDLNR